MRPYQSMPIGVTDGSMEQEGIGVTQAILACVLSETGETAASSDRITRMATSK